MKSRQDPRVSKEIEDDDIIETFFIVIAKNTNNEVQEWLELYPSLIYARHLETQDTAIAALLIRANTNTAKEADKLAEITTLDVILTTIKALRIAPDFTIGDDDGYNAINAFRALDKSSPAGRQAVAVLRKHGYYDYLVREVAKLPMFSSKYESDGVIEAAKAYFNTPEMKESLEISKRISRGEKVSNEELARHAEILAAPRNIYYRAAISGDLDEETSGSASFKPSSPHRAPVQSKPVSLTPPPKIIRSYNQQEELKESYVPIEAMRANKNEGCLDEIFIEADQTFRYVVTPHVNDEPDKFYDITVPRVDSRGNQLTSVDFIKLSRNGGLLQYVPGNGGYSQINQSWLNALLSSIGECKQTALADETFRYDVTPGYRDKPDRHYELRIPRVDMNGEQLATFDYIKLSRIGELLEYEYGSGGYTQLNQAWFDRLIKAKTAKSRAAAPAEQRTATAPTYKAPAAPAPALKATTTTSSKTAKKDEKCIICAVPRVEYTSPILASGLLSEMHKYPEIAGNLLNLSSEQQQVVVDKIRTDGLEEALAPFIEENKKLKSFLNEAKQYLTEKRMILLEEMLGNVEISDLNQQGAPNILSALFNVDISQLMAEKLLEQDKQNMENSEILAEIIEAPSEGLLNHFMAALRNSKTSQALINKMVEVYKYLETAYLNHDHGDRVIAAELLFGDLLNFAGSNVHGALPFYGGGGGGGYDDPGYGGSSGSSGGSIKQPANSSDSIPVTMHLGLVNVTIPHNDM